MAKQAKLIVDASEAVKAIRNLREAVKKYGDRLEKLHTLQTNLNKEYTYSSVVIHNFREKVGNVNSAMARQQRVLESTMKKQRAFRDDIGETQAHLRMLKGGFNSIERASITASGRLYDLSGSFGKLNQQVKKDQEAVRETVAILRLFGKHLAIVTKSMIAKNEAAGLQVRVMREDAAATNRSARAALSAARAYELAIRVFQGMVMYRAFTMVTSAIRQAFDRAKDFSIAISEIKTIEGQVGLATEVWAAQLRELTSELGIPELEAAEAAYQALSDQVVEAGQVQTFLREQIKLSITAVSSLAAATNSTDSILNAFGLSAAHASRINAGLFKTVDLGRARLEDIGDEIGAVAILSDQLNLTFIEQQAALTLLNRKGITFSESVTLLRNLLRALLKPTDAMNQIFAKWGVTSGQSALSTFGLVEVLNRLANEAFNAGDEAAEMAEIFGRMRAITAAAGLSQKEFNEEIARFADSAEIVDRAFGIRMESIGQRATKHFEKIRLFFTETFGDKMVELFVGFMDMLEKNSDLIQTVASKVFALARAYIVYRTVIYTVTKAVAAYNKVQALLASPRLISGIINLINQIGALRVHLMGAGAVAVLLAEAVYQYVTRYQRLADSAAAAGEALQRAFGERGQEAFDAFQRAIDKAFEKFEADVRSAMQVYFAFVTNLRRWNTQLANSIQDELATSFANLKRTVTSVLEDLKDQVKEVFDQIDRRAAEVDRVRQRADERELRERFDRAMNQFEADGNPLAKLEQFQNQLFREALAALDAGNMERAEILFDQAQKAMEKIRGILNEFKNIKDQDALRGVNIMDIQAKAANKLLELEKQRADQVQRRIEAERAFADDQEKKIEKEREEANARKEKFAELENILAQIDAFEKGGDPKAFGDLIAQASQAADAAGVDPEDKLRLLRSANAQEIALIREHEREKARIQLDAAQKRLQAVQEALEEANKKRVDIEKEVQEGLTKTAPDKMAGPVGTLLDLFGGTLTDKQRRSLDIFAGIDAKSIGNRNAPVGFFSADPEVFKRQKEMVETLERIQQLQNQLNDAPAHKRAGIAGEILQDIIRVKELFGFLGGSKFGGKTGFMHLDEMGFGDLVQQLNAASEEYKKHLQTHQEFVDQYGDLQERLRLLQDTISQIPKAFREVEEVQRETVHDQIKTWEGLRQVLNGIIRDLREVQRIQNELGPIVPGGGQGVGHHAFGTGPRGTDRHLAYLARGESVLTSQANRLFAPVAHAMNKANPGLRGQGSVMNFGDIIINQASGSAPLTVDRFVNELNRRKRRGLV